MPPSSTASTIAMFLSGAENIIQLKRCQQIGDSAVEREIWLLWLIYKALAI
jgi:hypothetical protein